MQEITTTEKSLSLGSQGSENESSNEKIFFKLKQLHGDKSIYLGQSILALISLNQSSAYSETINHSFIVELFASLIEELSITPEDLRKELDSRNEWIHD